MKKRNLVGRVWEGCERGGEYYIYPTGTKNLETKKNFFPYRRRILKNNNSLGNIENLKYLKFCHFNKGLHLIESYALKFGNQKNRILGKANGCT